ncbi:TetR/AcrR family transcriptional regulator [Aeromicrobium panaciterrae]|uniref:TetR/AcrR family transcriptional regulator n=1 Tax=Aeromicrobium panaciterrae TaxID=363861 RepID=UPI0031D470AE
MSKGDETRDAILTEATSVASKVGLTGMSIGQLAAHTGMSKSGLYAHFASKEALQIEILRHTRERFVDRVVRPALQSPRGLNRLRTLFESWLAWSEAFEDGGCLFVAASSELDDQPGPVRDALVRDERDWLELIVTIAATAVSEGEFRSDVDVEQIAYELHAIMLNHQHTSRLMQDPRALERARRAFDSIVERALTT